MRPESCTINSKRGPHGRTPTPCLYVVPQQYPGPTPRQIPLSRSPSNRPRFGRSGSTSGSATGRPPSFSHFPGSLRLARIQDPAPMPGGGKENRTETTTRCRLSRFFARRPSTLKFAKQKWTQNVDVETATAVELPCYLAQLCVHGGTDLPRRFTGGLRFKDNRAQQQRNHQHYKISAFFRSTALRIV